MRRSPAPSAARLRPLWCGLPLCGLLLCSLLLGSQPLPAADIQPRPQALLLPMPELLKRLGAPEEWLLLPLARYRELVAAGEQAAVSAPAGGPGGAWIESAALRGRLVDDRELHLEAELSALSAVAGPARLALFAELPEHLGAVTCDGAAALFVADGHDLVLPAAGRHALRVHWSIALAADRERNLRAHLVLPLAAAIDLRLESATPGSFQGDGLVEVAAASVRQWRLAAAGATSLALGWQPGLLAGEDQPVFGVQQELAVEIHPGQRAWQWSAALEPRRGPIPPLITLGLPAGWVLTGTGSGVLGSDGSSGTLRLRVDARAGRLSCSGFMAEDAVVALPQLPGAAYAGGLIHLHAMSDLAYELPAGWRLAGADFPAAGAASRSFVVPAPDRGMRVAAAAAILGPEVGLSACLVVGPLAGDWLLEETVHVRTRSGRLFALPLQLPPGWRLRSFSAEPHATISALSAAGELEQLPAGATLTLECPSGFAELAHTAVH